MLAKNQENPLLGIASVDRITKNGKTQISNLMGNHK